MGGRTRDKFAALPPSTFLTVMCWTPLSADPVVTNIAFEAFACHDELSDGSQWLIADVGIQCWTPYHDRVRGIAWVAQLVQIRARSPHHETIPDVDRASVWASPFRTHSLDIPFTNNHPAR